MRKSFLAALPLAMMLALSPAYAVDGYSVALGRGDNSTDLARLHAKWNWDRKWFEAGDWHLAGYWEATLGHWRGGGAGSRNLWEIGFTPVFRLQPNGRKTGMYLQGGIGAHLLSEGRINDSRVFGTKFNFASHLGIGATFGEHGQYDLGYRIQHVSNADIKQPNDGIDLHLIHFGYHY